MNPGQNVTQVLSAIGAGDPHAAAELLPLVYSHLRAIAQQRMAGERRGHTLQATALVHEAYLRLVGDADVSWSGRGHFFAAAAESMRRILIEHARKHGAIKRGGDRQRQTDWSSIEDVADLAAADNSDEILSVDAAILRLEKEEPQTARIVRLRFYAGLSTEQTAEALGVSTRTVERDWRYARTWLLKALQGMEE